MKNSWKLSAAEKSTFDSQGYLRLKNPYMLELKALVHHELREICLAIIARSPRHAKSLPELQKNGFAEIFNWAIANEQNFELSRPFYEIFPTAPSVINLVGNERLISLAQELAIRHPLASTLPLLRIDRPKNNRWSTPVHQDVWFAMLSENCVTYWFPMLPVTQAMGPLWIIPGSHKLGILPIREWSAENPFTTKEEFPEHKFMPVTLADDELLVFHQCLVHKSGDNESSQARLTLQMRYNDLHTLKEPTTSFTVHHSRYVIDAQKNLLRQSQTT